MGAVGSTPRSNHARAANAVISTFMVGLNKAVDAWLEKEPEAKGTKISRGRLYLSGEEAAALNRDIDELLERYDASRNSRNRPADAMPRNQYWLLLPHTPVRGR